MDTTSSPPGPGQEPTLELSEFVPFYIRSIANKLAQAASRTFKQKFGIGLNEWSCLAALAAEPSISASRICEVSGFDKSLISRSLRSLEGKGLVAVSPGPGTRRLLVLTEAGRSMYRAIRQHAIAREQQLLAGLSGTERATLLKLLKHLHRSAGTLGPPR